jgi:hypothetical protein
MPPDEMGPLTSLTKPRENKLVINVILSDYCSIRRIHGRTTAACPPIFVDDLASRQQSDKSVLSNSWRNKIAWNQFNEKILHVFIIHKLNRLTEKYYKYLFEGAQLLYVVSFLVNLAFGY